MAQNEVRDYYARQIHGELATIAARERRPRPSASTAVAVPSPISASVLALVGAVVVLTRVAGRIASTLVR